jgi:serine/threonine-protein kinase
MSPEQCRGTREIDHRTDIYALGVILFEMLCGRAPFVSEGFGEMVHLHISAPPPPPRSIEPGVPEDLERLILWCLAKEPDDRVQTMTDVHAALTGRPTPPARATAPTARTPRQPGPPPTPTTFTQAGTGALATDVTPRSRRKAPAIVLGVVAIGAVALLTRGSWMPRSSDTVTVAPAATAPAKPTPAPAAPTAAPAAPAKVTAAIVSDPPGARVVREKDGAVIGMTPFRETWPSGDGVRKLRLELDGYRTEAVAAPARSQASILSFALRKSPSRTAQAHKTRRADRCRGSAPRLGARPCAEAGPRAEAAAKSEPVPL